jgi:hypothetical protein
VEVAAHTLTLGPSTLAGHVHVAVAVKVHEQDQDHVQDTAVLENAHASAC